jgi:inosine-uridine nucleoside N-ribohydrolase
LVETAHVIFDSGVPFVHVPCVNVTEHLKTTLPEMEAYVSGQGKIGDYLYKIFLEYYEDHFGKSKEIWDVGPVGWLVNPAWTTSRLIHSPVLTAENAWGFDPARHFIREIYSLERDSMFGDLFRKLAKFAGA